MGVYDGFADAPNQILREGREITLKFERGSNNTAILSWNIPAPTAGCGTDFQGAYDGIVITVHSKPSNYISNSPKDSNYYAYDPTADENLHTGDRLDGALVVGAFYHDRKTTSLIVNDVKDKTPYYFSAYAVDKVGRYHREGVHAYSLPNSNEEAGTPDIVAHHDVAIDVIGGIKPSLKTGLLNKNYNEKISINDQEYVITINGVEAASYAMLIKEFNKQIAFLESPYILNDYPLKNSLYLDKTNYKLFSWDGLTHNELDLTVSPIDISVGQIGSFWLDSNKNIYIYESAGWRKLNIIKSATRPDLVECGQIWYDGVDVWRWDANHWCKLCVYSQERNPVLPPVLECGTYWFNSSTSLFYSWNVNVKKWEERLVLLSDKDPNTLISGDFWYDESVKKIKRLVGGLWNELTSIRYAERNAEGGLDNPGNAVFWFIESEQILYRRDNDDLEWVVQEFTSYPSDPLNRESCDLWWKSDDDFLYAWDALNLRWVLVNSFTISAVDPSLAIQLPDCAIWYNPVDRTIKTINGSQCANVDYIEFGYPPDNLPLETIWSDGKKYFIYDGSYWTEITYISSITDPFEVSLGEYWYNTVDGILRIWNGSGWDVITPSLVPITPKVGTMWYNIETDILFKWNGSKWVVTQPLAFLELIPPKTQQGRSILRLATRDAGCQYGVAFIQENADLLSSLAQRILYYEEVRGASGVDAGPMYKILGVGDDGSPDERRQLHDDIRSSLGAGSVKIELKKNEIDLCIDNALKELRKFAGVAYRRVFFFLDLKANQQTYVMSNKCVGFNKIVKIMNLYRMKGGWLSTSLAGQDLFIYGAMQQLYTLGTFDTLTYHLVASYMEELETLFASKIIYNWHEQSRELRLHQIIPRNERILVDAVIERTEQELFTDRETALWVQRWAVAEAKNILSQVRGKFQTLPGPSGSTTLNSQELITQAETEKQELRAMLLDHSMQNIEEYGAAYYVSIG